MSAAAGDEDSLSSTYTSADITEVDDDVDKCRAKSVKEAHT